MIWWRRRQSGGDSSNVVFDIGDEVGNEEVEEGVASSLSVLNDKIEAPYHPKLHFLSDSDTVGNQEIQHQDGTACSSENESIIRRC